MLPLLRALRPKQWAKNSFVLAPLVFAHKAFDPDAVIQAALTFIAFSLVASAVYLVNDVIDRDRDRSHPVKSKRPIAAGLVKPVTALMTSALFALAALAIAWSHSVVIVAILGGYLVLNLGYTFWLKHMVLVDLFAIAIGFVLRVEAGAEAIDVTASRWIVTCTLFLALLMAASKRRSEVELQGADKGTRVVLSNYSLPYLDTIITITAAGAILSYALYTMSPMSTERLNAGLMVYTLPFAIFAIFRYIYLVRESAKGENPFEILVGDVPMVVNLTCYTVVTVGLVYLP